MSVEPKSNPGIAMKRDWDQRAAENARWYINTLSWDQSEEEFDLSGRREFDGQVLADLGILTDRRDPKSLRILEVGCGLGRITTYLADIFGEVCATDVSGEMIRRASSRLSNRTNVTFRETNGEKFPDFDDETFDVVFAAYVFQHIPSPDIIESNIREGFRVLKPRGVFKFVTNGVHNEEFRKMQKDTWTGAAFPEASIRRLAMEIKAKLPGVHGDGTQYCWSFMRKPALDRSPSGLPVIELVGRAENLSNGSLTPRIGDIALAMNVRGVDYNSVDINNTVVGFRDRRLIPCYAGPTRIDSNLLLDGGVIPEDRDRIQVSVMISAAEPAGDVELFVEFGGSCRSESVKLILPDLQRSHPIIHLVLDATDNTIDLVRAKDTAIRAAFSHAGNDTKPAEVCFRINSRPVTSTRPVYLAANGLWVAAVQLPERLDDNPAVLEVEVDGLSSPQFPIAFSTDN
jgi:SAM-dependent methyltransferase